MMRIVTLPIAYDATLDLCWDYLQAPTDVVRVTLNQYIQLARIAAEMDMTWSLGRNGRVYGARLEVHYPNGRIRQTGK